MKELLTTDQNIEMTSRDLAEITGKNHKEILRDIRKEAKELGYVAGRIFALSEYTDSTNRKLPCYKFGKKGAMQLALKYDAVTRFKVIEKIEELENKKTPTLPANYLEALKSLIVVEEEKQALMIENKTNKPKVEFFDKCIDSESLIDMNDAAKTLGIKKDGKILGRNLLFKELRDLKILTTDNRPYQKYIKQKIFELKEKSYTHPKTSEVILYFKTFLTSKGIVFIRDKIENGVTEK